MSARRCCEVASSGSTLETIEARSTRDDPHPATLARRCRDLAGWMIPGVILALLPSAPRVLRLTLRWVQGLGFPYQDDDLFHTYSTFARGCEALTDAYRLLDTTPYGRQQDFEDSPTGWPQKPTYGQFETTCDSDTLHFG